MKYQFYCKESKMNKRGLSPIQLSISINGQRKFINLDRLESPKVFKEFKDPLLRSFIASIDKKINDAVADAYNRNISITISYIINRIKSKKIIPITINELAVDYITNNNLSKESINKYNIILKELDINTIPISTINNRIVKEWINTIKSKHKESTAVGKIRKIKSIIEYAKRKGLIEEDVTIPKIRKPKPIVEYLTEEEIDIIKNKKIDIKRLEQVRDIFLFQVGSGLSYADINELTEEDLKGNIITKRRKKTNIEFISVLLPIATNIVLKYNYILPIISNQKMNAYLKEIADICGIKKNLHTHLARKTYATLLLNKGVSIEVISKTLGHSNTRITQECYAHLQQKTIAQEVLSKLERDDITN